MVNDWLVRQGLSCQNPLPDGQRIMGPLVRLGRQTPSHMVPYN